MNGHGESLKSRAFLPRSDDLVQTVRSRSRDSLNVCWPVRRHRTHFGSHLHWGELTETSLFEVLRHGVLAGSIEPAGYPGAWKCVLEREANGRTTTVEFVLSNGLILVHGIECIED